MRGIALAVSTWLGATGWAGSSLAQTGDPLLIEESLPYLTVTSDPPGAVVRLSGEYEWVGRTPWSLHRPLSGIYRVEAHVPGYQIWHGQIMLGPGEPQDLRIRLSKKTRFGAGVRSLVLPGWGQRYNDVPTRGWVYTIGEIAALSGSIVFWEIYQDRGRVRPRHVRIETRNDRYGLRDARGTVEKSDDARGVGPLRARDRRRRRHLRARVAGFLVRADGVLCGGDVVVLVSHAQVRARHRLARRLVGSRWGRGRPHGAMVSEGGEMVKKIRSGFWLRGLLLIAASGSFACGKDHGLDREQSSDPGPSAPCADNDRVNDPRNRSVQLTWELGDSSIVSRVDRYRVYRIENTVRQLADSAAAPPSS
jgi:hypothetical protein